MGVAECVEPLRELGRTRSVVDMGLWLWELDLGRVEQVRHVVRVVEGRRG